MLLLLTIVDLKMYSGFSRLCADFLTVDIEKTGRVVQQDRLRRSVALPERWTGGSLFLHRLQLAIRGTLHTLYENAARYVYVQSREGEAPAEPLAGALLGPATPLQLFEPVARIVIVSGRREMIAALSVIGIH